MSWCATNKDPYPQFFVPRRHKISLFHFSHPFPYHFPPFTLPITLFIHITSSCITKPYERPKIMAKLAIILAIVVAFLATAAFALDDAQLRSQFNEFIVQQTRKYKTAEEFEFRYQVFKTNSETAARLTAESKTAEFSAMNQFGDWTEEERKNWLGRLPTAPQRQKQVKTLAKQSPKASSGAPSFSLTKKGVVAPVVNQGSCGMF